MRDGEFKKKCVLSLHIVVPWWLLIQYNIKSGQSLTLVLFITGKSLHSIMFLCGNVTVSKVQLLDTVG